MKEILKTIPSQLLAILMIILCLIGYGLYLSKVAEKRCIYGAEKESMNGKVSQEIINWCKNTF